MLKVIYRIHDKRKLIVCIILTVATLAAFGQVNQFDFVFDDIAYITGNSNIQSGITLKGFHWAFSTTYVEFWHPLTWLSLMLDYQFHGLNAGGYHLTNLILHILSTLLMFRLFNLMTKKIWESAFIAALFALHPMHVESVAWVSERKDVLSTFFCMITLCLYVHYTEKPVIKRYLPVLFSYVLALLSKPMIITLPIIMILLDYWPLSRFSMGIEPQKRNLILWQLKEKLLFFVLSAAFSMITIYAQHDYAGRYYHIPLSSRLANASVSFITYLGKTYWPIDLAAFYPFSAHIPMWQIIITTFLIVFISATVIIMAKQMPYLFVGWMWHTLTLLPVMGIIQISVFSMADRYNYLASTGIAVIMAEGIPPLVKSENIRKNILFPMAIAVTIVMAVLTWKQCSYWENSIQLWNHALQVTKNNYVAYTNRGNKYNSLGQYQLAIEDCTKAIGLQPNMAAPYGNRGNAYYKLGQYHLAIKDYSDFIRLRPDYAVVYYNRGIIYSSLGQHQTAIEDFTKAIRLNHNYTEAYNNRGMIYGRLGQYQPAIEDFTKAIRLNPNYTEAYNNRGFAYFLLGNKELSCRDAQKACAIGICQTLALVKNRGFCP